MRSSGAIDRIFGVVHFDGRPVGPARLGAMAAALSPPAVPTSAGSRRVEQHVRESVGMGCLRTSDAGDMPACPFVHLDSGVIVTADARIYGRPDLLRSLGHGEASAVTDSQLIAEAYLRWGPLFAARIRGDFAAAVWDPRSRSLLIARDHIGCAPLFYAPLRTGVVFASDIHGVVAALDHVPDLDPDWIPSLLTGDQSDPERVPYAEVRRALPGHAHRADQSGMRTQRYWDLDSTVTLVLASDDEYEDAFRARLADAVRVRVPCGTEPVGSELSGGLDSSTVTALASRFARACGAPFVSLSHVLPDDLQNVVWPHTDEREWAGQLRRHAGIDAHVPVPAGGYSAIESLQRGIRVHATPSLDTFAVFPDALYDRAREHRVSTLFSGFGGDHMVSGAARFARAPRRASIREWCRARVNTWLRRPVTSAERKLAHGEARSRDIVRRLPVTAEYTERWNLRERAMADWRQLTEATKASGQRAYERHRVVLQAATGERLESGNVAAGACGLGYRYPLLDVPLLEFFHAVPPEQKWRAGWGRYLFRRSIREWVPDTVRWRPNKQGATLPNCLARFRGCEAAVRDVLARSRGRPELEFLDFNRMDRWADEIFTSARGEDARGAVDLRFGRFNAVLALAAYYDMRAAGWLPGRPVA